MAERTDIYAGLSEQEWHQLKLLVLNVQHKKSAIVIPAHLSEHSAAKHLKAFIFTGSKESLNKAVAAMCPHAPDKAWLILAKS